MTQEEQKTVNRTDPPSDMFPADDENHAPEAKKAGVAVWEYQNTEEDFKRLIVISLQNLEDQLEDGTLERGDIQKIVYGMEGAISVLKEHFNIYPKSAEFDNKKPNDFDMLDLKNNNKD